MFDANRPSFTVYFLFSFLFHTSPRSKYFDKISRDRTINSFYLIAEIFDKHLPKVQNRKLRFVLRKLQKKIGFWLDTTNRESGFNFLFFFFVFAPSQGPYFLLGCSAHDCAEGSERAENVQKRRNMKI